MKEFSELVDLMATLRGDNGCAWDKKQTVREFKTFLLEEVYELIDAIDREDFSGIKEELGDLLFHLVFISRISAEKGYFTMQQVVADTRDKMWRRHPHVFSQPSQKADHQVEKNWEELKKEEKPDYSLFAHIPKSMPALLRAYIITRRASRGGFDWENIDSVYEKVFEEIDEVKEAEATGNKSLVREEIGDALFALANLSRWQGIDPEDALRQAMDKFSSRFRRLEEMTGLRDIADKNMAKLWDEVKGTEKGRS